MSEYDLALAIGLAVALGLSIGNLRAWAWLLAAAASFVASTIYWRLGLPYAPFFGGLCDAAICLAVYFFARYRWEMWIWRLFQASVAVNFYYLGALYGLWGNLGHNAVSAILEFINWIALLFLGGSGIFERVGSADVFYAAHRPWSRVLRFVRSLQRERKIPAFYKTGS